MRFHITYQKASHALVALAVLAGAVLLFYPTAIDIYEQHTGGWKFVYAQDRPVVSEVDLSGAPPARAVPMLMYHGVVNTFDASNTRIDRFVAQMEMLKREGYETISVREMDEAFKGNLVLPPKPIIITFDDGRKDSYYHVDQILEALGFRATIFVATGRANSNDKFYLSWDELKILRDSGRWEIEAHGRNSHDLVAVDEQGNRGRYLTSLMYVRRKGMETPEEFTMRIEDDYKNGIGDIQKNLGLTPRYYAVPLNDYGHESASYEESLVVNKQLTERYFRFAFVQANEHENVISIARSFYNWPGDDPWNLRRLDVKNMTAETLKNIMETWAPTPPHVKLSRNDPQAFAENTQLLWGTTAIDGQGTHLIGAPENPSAVAVFGEPYWRNYAVSASVKRIRGSSVVLLASFKDKENFISYGITDDSIFLRETVNGVTRELYTLYNMGYTDGQEVWLTLAVKNGYAAGYLNDTRLFRSVPVTQGEGKVGFKVWDSQGDAEGILGALYVKPL